MDDPRNVPSEEKDPDEILLDDSNIELTNPQHKQKADLHEQVQHWTDSLYNSGKKILIIVLGCVFLVDIIFPNSSSAIEIVTKLYKLSLEQGRIEILAPAIAIFFLARNLPVFVKGMRRMFKNS